MLFNYNLRFLREKSNKRQSEIAELLGISSSRYNHYESEKDIIPMKHLITLCNYFNISFDYIFNLTSTRNYKNCKKEISLVTVGMRLKEVRKENKLTQIKLAKILNIANTMISEYEKGNYLISTHALFEICKKYKISADYLLGRVDAPKYLN